MNPEINITSAQYTTEHNLSIYVVIDGQQLTVPLDPNNRHYAEIMRQVDEGTLTIQDAE